MQTQQNIVRIQGKGLITIPKALRDTLNLEKDTYVRIFESKGRLMVEPVRTLPYKARSYKTSEVVEFLNTDKKESKNLKKKGLI